MTEINPPGFMQNRTDHTAAIDRGTFTGTIAESCVVGATDFLVTQRAAGANMSVDVTNGGQCYIDGTESATQGTYSCLGDSTSVNLAISASSPTLPRIDIVVAKVQDAFYSGATNAWSLAVVTGTPAASPVPPTAPVNSLTLAQIAVAANATTVVNANITDKRKLAHGALQGGYVTCTSTTRPSNPWGGLLIRESDTGLIWQYDGTAWRKIPWAVSSGYLLTQMQSAIATTANLTLSTTVTDVTGATLTLTTTKANALYEAFGQVQLRTSVADAGSTARGWTYLDGAALTPHSELGMDSVGRATITHVATGTVASAGSHTWKIRGDRSSTGGTSFIDFPNTFIVVKIYEP
jgi:hypothetical protein